jgi:hypothetical protein
LLKELKTRLLSLNNEKGCVIVLEIVIHEGGVRGWRFFKKKKI